MTIDEALNWAKSKLDEPSEAYYLLSEYIGQSRSYIYTWPDKSLSLTQQQDYQAAVLRRVVGEPVAYILGKKDFWSFTLQTSPHTLIPRPESELLVEAVLELGENDDKLSVCDLGTGTGAIALAIAMERPAWHVQGVDRVAEAVDLANINAQALSLCNTKFTQSDWFSELQDHQFNILVSNPPYVEQGSPYLNQGDLRFEPDSALTAGQDGLDDIRTIIRESVQHLATHGWLLIEHGFQQHEDVANLLQNAGFIDIRALRDLNHHVRVTLGKINTECD